MVSSSTCSTILGRGRIGQLVVRRQRQQQPIITVKRPLLTPCCFRRFFSSSSDPTTSSSSTNKAFDRQLKKLQRNNAARAHKLWHNNSDSNDDDVINYDYFHEEIANRLIDRLDDIKRDEGFPLALNIGSGPGFVYKAICSDDAVQEDGGGIGGVKKLVQIDSSEGMLYRDIDDEDIDEQPANDDYDTNRCDTYRMAVNNEEDKLPFPDGTFDLVIGSTTSIHWINNLPALFQEIHRVLKPDGCFLLAMVGGTTLPELRASMVMAELERTGGVSTHVGPFVELSDVGALLQRAGFALPTIDVDTLTLTYPNAAVLMEHLQRMGENNACLKRRTDQNTSLDVFLATSCIYDTMFRLDHGGGNSQEEEESEIEASVQVIYAIGWTPHESQQRPLERGTATHKVGDTNVEVVDEEVIVEKDKGATR